MAEPSRPSIVSKRTHVRQQKHTAIFGPEGLPASPRVIDSLVAGVGYASIVSVMVSHFRSGKANPWEMAGIALGSLTVGFGLFDLGKRYGMIQGASFALRPGGAAGEQKVGRWRMGEEGADDDWRDEFKGREYEDLKVAEKMAWLRKEEKRIREIQAAEQLTCGKAYIAKEEAYTAYEKHGHYGGKDWKAYNEADTQCQDMYTKYQRQENRLREIRHELDDLNDEI